MEVADRRIIVVWETSEAWETLRAGETLGGRRMPAGVGLLFEVSMPAVVILSFRESAKVKEVV